MNITACVQGRTRSISHLAAGFLLAIAVVCLAPATAEAQTKTWFGTFGGAWSNPNNWSGGSVPSGTTTQLRWTSASTGTLTSTNDISGLTAAGMVFTGAPGPVTIGGNSLAISATTTSVSIQTGAQAVTIDMPLSMRFGTLTLNTSGGGPLTINGVIGESGTVAGISFAGSSGWGAVTLNGTNTFSGAANVNSGTLTIGNLDAISAAQALGSGATIRLGYRLATDQGFIRYTGPATTTNKRIQLGDANNYQGGGGFLNDGTGAVIWTGSMVTQGPGTSGTRSFTLGGSNADDNEWRSPIVNYSPNAPVPLTKSGTGKWILTGSNSYSGSTSVNEGTLLVNGNQSAATGAVTVASLATLGGSGTLGGAMTINGILAPGSGGIGTLTGTNGVTWNASAGNDWLFQLGTAAASLNAASTSTNNDLLNVTGAFAQGTGSTFTFDFLNSGSDGWYKLVDYTTTTFSTGTNASFQASNLPSGKTATFVVDSATTALYVQIVPEPSTIALLGVGGIALAAGLRRRRRPA